MTGRVGNLFSMNGALNEWTIMAMNAFSCKLASAREVSISGVLLQGNNSIHNSDVNVTQYVT